MIVAATFWVTDWRVVRTRCWNSNFLGLSKVDWRITDWLLESQRERSERNGKSEGMLGLRLPYDRLGSGMVDWRPKTVMVGSVPSLEFRGIQGCLVLQANRNHYRDNGQGPIEFEGCRGRLPTTWNVPSAARMDIYVDSTKGWIYTWGSARDRVSTWSYSGPRTGWEGLKTAAKRTW